MSIVTSVLLIGYGSVGQAITPLLFSHFHLLPTQVSAIAADDHGRGVAETFGIRHDNLPLTPENYQEVLGERLHAGDWLLNLAVDVSSSALIEWCREHGVYYLDTCVEPWSGGYINPDDIEATTNYALRHKALNLHVDGATTAVIAHGANPGLISHFVKAGLRALADVRQISTSHVNWAELAHRLGVKVIQIAECDTQWSNQSVPLDTFVNTWSVDGLLAEAWQCAEMGWGTHEVTPPATIRFHDYGDLAGVYVHRHGGNTLVQSWTPFGGEHEAYLLTHHESLSIANLLTIRGETPAEPLYRPTVYYAYRPAPATHASLQFWMREDYATPSCKRVMRDELDGGFDQLGVLFIFEGGAYWYGSTLHLSDARRLAPCNSATSLQVAAGILGALEWMGDNPDAGVVEAESLDHESVMRVAAPYLGDVRGVLTDWQPVDGADLQFADFLLSGSKEDNADVKESAS